MTTTHHQQFTVETTIDWSDLDRAAERAEELLSALAQDPALVEAANAVEPVRGSSCLVEGGHVLWEAIDGSAVLFAARSSSAGPLSGPPHVHDRPATALVLAGALTVGLFTVQGRHLAEGGGEVDDDFPRFIREDLPGRRITLHEDQRHISSAAPGTVVLVLAGPQRPVVA